jgi:DNA polymerase I-like protein with 3'-5' exonuclease and polymerase domains
MIITLIMFIIIIIIIVIIVIVKKWQDETQSFARRHAYVFTIMGRWRRLQDAKLSGGAAGHALRAAINTPIQGKDIG